MSLSKIIGSIFILIGTEVGAGILALPIVVAHYGFITGSILLFVTWSVMTYTSFVICDINLSMESGVNFATMSKKTLSHYGAFFTWIFMLLTLYPLLVAYMSASSSTFGALLHLPSYFAMIIFVIFLSVFVIAGTSKVDFINKLLLGSKLLLLIISCVFLIDEMHYSYLNISYNTKVKNILMAIPVFVTSFGGHIIIPTLRVYLLSDIKSIKSVLYIGCVVPLILYLLWVVAIIGNISPIGQYSIAYLNSLGDGATVGDILELLKHNVNSQYFITPILLFTTISVSTSFLSVSTSLKDFLIDGFRLNRINYIKRTSIIVLLVFIVPMIICLTFEKIFLSALNLVGISCIILFIIIPTIMALKHKFKNEFYLTNNKAVNCVVLSIGCMLLIVQVLSSFNYI